MTGKNKESDPKTIPYIKREIDGTVYTVKIHFQPNSKETAKEKMERLLVKEALRESLSE